MAIHRFLRNACFIVILFVLLPFARSYASTEPVSDIKGHWAESDIQEWLDQGLITGYPDHTFRPGAEVSRGEFVALVNRAFKYSDTKAISFKDLKPANFAYIEVQKATAQGYISGFSDNTFRPDKQITRQETAVIISRILGFDSEEATGSVSAQDANLIPAWSKPAVQYLLDQGIMSKNADGTFQPQRNMTRAETVVVIKKALALSTVVYDQTGTFGESAVSTVQHNVRIAASNVTLRNMHIRGDLVIAKEVADGNAYLEQVQVDGVTRIEGGGSNSIHIRNSKLNTVSVNRLNNAVRVVAEGTSAVQDVQILSSAVIEEKDITGDGFVNVTVLPNAQVSSSERTVMLAGDFKKVSVGGSLKEFKVLSGSIANLLIQENLVIPTLNFSKNVVIEKLEMKSKLTISGEGQVKGIVLSEGVPDPKLPKEQQPAAPATGGGGGGSSNPGPGGGSGGGSPDPGTGGGNGSTPVPALAVTGITAANGMLEVQFNRNLDNLPDAAEFAILEQVNHGEFHKVDVTLVTLLDNKATVQLTIPSIANSEAEQLAVYSVSYKGGSPVLSEAITVPKANVTVSGRLFIQPYTETKPLPAYNLHIYLRGAKDTRGNYTAIVGKGGEFSFDNVVPGTYVILMPLSPYTYYTDEFTVEAGENLVLPDLTVIQKLPEAEVDPITYTDLAYIRGSVQGLGVPFRVKIELENGKPLNTPAGKYDMFFGIDLYYFNPDLQLKGNDKVFVTLYTDYGWSSKRFEVKVVERPQTKAPVVTSVVYEDTNRIKGTIEDPSAEITITREDGTMVGKSSSYGNRFDIFLWNTAPLPAGEKLKVYAQAQGKRKSGPSSITVIVPTAVTAQPVVTETVYENDWAIYGTAEGESTIVVKREDGTTLGEQKISYQGYDLKYSVPLNPRPVVGETLYISAKGYEKLISKPVPIVVVSRPVTPTPTVVGVVYSDDTEFRAFVQYKYDIDVTLKDMNGAVIDRVRTFNGTALFWNVKLTGDTQYQITAEAPLLKESKPFVFTVIAPTVATSVPRVTSSVYAYNETTFTGTAEPFAKVYLYFDDGTLLHESQANSQGEFYMYMPSFPDRLVLPGDKLIIRADARGKLISDAVEVTAVELTDKSSQPILNNNIVYGYTTQLSGSAAKSTVIQVFYENGRPVYVGSYSDMNTGYWQSGIWSTYLHGGDRIYVIATEKGKLPSDPLYITIEPSTKADTPVVTGIVNAGDATIQGTYSGAVKSNGVYTTIFFMNENNEVYGSEIVQSDGSFSFKTYFHPLVSGEIIRLFAKEGYKEASELLTITVN
ncbi:S-layer homology domain-containing protein [Paenibacillus sp. FSL K6-1217]|uniref:S-layer homology domain-containing protein n=1 Tax=Paenibacillus sp. FSL K6-1217 TaxID=2921466 RepID=UPI00324EF594